MTSQEKDGLVRYSWTNKCFSSLKSVAGVDIEITAYGFEADDNVDADYVDVGITVDNVSYRGAVKFFEKSSQWNNWCKSHNMYYHIILLLVLEYDEPLECNVSTGSKPYVAIPIIDKELISLYSTLVSSGVSLCGNLFNTYDDLSKYHTFTRLLIGRLEGKYEHISKVYESHQRSFNDTLFYLVFDTINIANDNRAQFCLLADRIRLNELINKMATIEQVEALIFGTAGLLNIVTRPDSYTYKLRELFDTIKKNYDIEPLNVNKWIFSNASISITLAQLSSLVFKNKDMLISILESKSLSDIRTLFVCPVSEYWLTHSSLGVIENDTTSERLLTETKVDLFIINLVLPFLFFYNRKKDFLFEITDFIIPSLENMKGERNRYINGWLPYMTINNSFKSQAIVELTKKYCHPKFCYKCPLGVRFLKMKGVINSSNKI